MELNFAENIQLFAYLYFYTETIFQSPFSFKSRRNFFFHTNILSCHVYRSHTMPMETNANFDRTFLISSKKLQHPDFGFVIFRWHFTLWSRQWWNFWIKSQVRIWGKNGNSWRKNMSEVSTSWNGIVDFLKVK